MYVDVLVEIAIDMDKLFTYSVPSFFESKIKVGSIVKVPFGKRILEGFIIEIKEKVDFETKDIIELKEEIILNEEMISLGKYMSKTYVASLISCYKAMLPSFLKFNDKKNIKKIKYIVINELKDVEKKSEKNILLKFKNSKKIKKSEITNKSALENLLNKKILKEIEEEEYRLKYEVEKYKEKTLTKKQQDIYLKIKNSENRTFLLRGVTGSGKTEIYIKLIEDIIKDEKEAIILVPEIAITTQLINRFKGKFNNLVAVIHSSLSDGERYDEYRKIQKKEAKIVIGARSAIFAPFTNLGIIIIDEEHENSYKQENNPRYNTLDIAIERTKYNNSILLLGSATPSLESYARSKTNKYELLELLERINKKEMPKVTIIDMKDELRKRNTILSDLAKQKINEKLEKKEQIMILLNRRGYSNYLMCNDCGEVLKCPNCDISLTYHKHSNIMKCHYCGYANKKQEICTKCNSKNVVLRGSGTEKAEEYLNQTYKQARILRMDKDTTSKKGSHNKIINDFNDKKYDILIGTQMIAKGLDFENVTLVVILNGDYSLYIPDYRSGEKTFQLLTQAAGRAGRKDLEGEIIIQTFNPNNYAIQTAKNHDYLSFYNQEMFIRKRMFYPPFCFIVAIRVISKDYDLGDKTINKIDTYLRGNLDENYVILGPSASIKINQLYKFQNIIKYKEKEKLYEVLNEINQHFKNTNIKLEIDFNPLKL